MEDKEALTLFFERSNAMQTYWSYYITVVLGVLAFFGAGSPRSVTTAGLISVTFLGFARANYQGMTDVARQRVEVCKYLIKPEYNCSKLPCTIKSPLPITLNPPAVNAVKAFHIVVDVLTIGAIAFLTFFRIS
ncbi:MAG: hypothetical protein LAP21_05150 [Acidobacteriia bacterium]|nr:hypothetical protein [Terriglobia bacterium]